MVNERKKQSWQQRQRSRVGVLFAVSQWTILSSLINWLWNQTSVFTAELLTILQALWWIEETGWSLQWLTYRKKTPNWTQCDDENTKISMSKEDKEISLLHGWQDIYSLLKNGISPMRKKALERDEEGRFYNSLQSSLRKTATTCAGRRIDQVKSMRLRLGWAEEWAGSVKKDPGRKC